VTAGYRLVRTTTLRLRRARSPHHAVTAPVASNQVPAANQDVTVESLAHVGGERIGVVPILGLESRHIDCVYNIDWRHHPFNERLEDNGDISRGVLARNRTCIDSPRHR
jgi:hypothetical protein